MYKGDRYYPLPIRVKHVIHKISRVVETKAAARSSLQTQTNTHKIFVKHSFLTDHKEVRDAGTKMKSEKKSKEMEQQQKKTCDF